MSIISYIYSHARTLKNNSGSVSNVCVLTCLCSTLRLEQLLRRTPMSAWGM